MALKPLLIILFVLLTSGCSGPQDGVLSSLLMGGTILVIIIFSAIVHYTIKGSKLLVGITPEQEKRNEKKKLKEARKKYLKEISKQISDDRKFVKKNYQQYVKDYERKYPNSRHYLSHSGWINQVAKVKQRIKSHDQRELYNKKSKSL